MTDRWLTCSLCSSTGGINVPSGRDFLSGEVSTSLDWKQLIHTRISAIQYELDTALLLYEYVTTAVLTKSLLKKHIYMDNLHVLLVLPMWLDFPYLWRLMKGISRQTKFLHPWAGLMHITIEVQFNMNLILLLLYEYVTTVVLTKSSPKKKIYG